MTEQITRRGHDSGALSIPDGLARGERQATMRTMAARLERWAANWLYRASVPLLRISMGAIFLGFGALKFFPGVSPAEDLAIQTVAQLTFGLMDGSLALLFVAGLEVSIGIILLTGRLLSVGLPLLVMQMGGILAPLSLFPDRLFAGPGLAPTIEGQYVLKDLVLLAGVVVLWADFLKSRSSATRPTRRPPGAVPSNDRQVVVHPDVLWRGY